MKHRRSEGTGDEAFYDTTDGAEFGSINGGSLEGVESHNALVGKRVEHVVLGAQLSISVFSAICRLVIHSDSSLRRGLILEEDTADPFDSLAMTNAH